MNFTTEDIQLAVKKGVSWLDENHPNWVSDINLENLVMQNCHNCIIGQAVGIYWEAVSAASGSGDHDTHVAWAIERGFCAPRFRTRTYGELGVTDYNTQYSYYRGLETVWSEEVRKRLG